MDHLTHIGGYYKAHVMYPWDESSVSTQVVVEAERIFGITVTLKDYFIIWTLELQVYFEHFIILQQCISAILHNLDIYIIFP